MSGNKIINKVIIIAIVVLLIGMTYSTSSLNKYYNTSSKIYSSNEIPGIYEQFKIFKDIYDPLNLNYLDVLSDEDIILDAGYSVTQTVDGGYIVAGYTESLYGEGHMYYSYALLVKFDADGNQEWNKTFKGLDLAVGMSVQETTDDGYITAGYTMPKSGGNVSILLLKTDDAGNKEWEQTFQIMNGSLGYSVQQTSSEDYVISGCAFSYDLGEMNLLLIKTDSEGNMIWNNTYLSGDIAYGMSCSETVDSGYIIGGTQRSYDFFGMNSTAVLIKTNSEGTEEWNHTFSGSNYSQGCSVQQVNDRGYILVGATISEETGNVSCLLLKIDAEGDETWNKTFSFLGYTVGVSIQQTDDNGYIITGATGNITEEYNAKVLLFKTDYFGDEEWNKTFEFDDSISIGISLDQTTDEGYIITGYKATFGLVPIEEWEMDGILIKTDSNGIEEWKTTFEIKGPEPLTADAGGPYVGALGEAIEFNGDASGGIPPYSFLWDFGDGNTSEEQDATHVYNATGNYIAKLFVTDYMGKNANNSADVTITYCDTEPPIINIIKPERALYLFNKRLIDLSSPLIIGAIDIEVEASDSESGIKVVKFYIDGELKENDTSEPYVYTWNKQAILAHHIKVEAYDYSNNIAKDSITVFTLNLFPDIQFGVLKGKVKYNNSLFGMVGLHRVNVTAESVTGTYTKHTFTKMIPFINLGNFTLGLPTGIYNVTVEKEGFIAQQREVEVILGDNEFLYFELEKT